MNIFPLAPKDPVEASTIQEAFKREAKLYRKKPVFIICMTLYVLCLFALIYITDGILPRVLIAFSIFSAGVVFDSVVAHFIQRLLEAEGKKQV